MVHWIGILIGGVFVLGLAYQITETFGNRSENERREQSRVHSYVLCVVLVFAGSVAFGCVVAAPIYPGDEGGEYRSEVATEYHPGMSLTKRDDLIEKTFLVTVLPALIGVRIALGSKRKPKTKGGDVYDAGN